MKKCSPRRLASDPIGLGYWAVKEERKEEDFPTIRIACLSLSQLMKQPSIFFLQCLSLSQLTKQPSTFSLNDSTYNNVGGDLLNKVLHHLETNPLLGTSCSTGTWVVSKNVWSPSIIYSGMPFARRMHYNFTYVMLHNNSPPLFKGPSTHYQNDSPPLQKCSSYPPLIHKKKGRQHIENKVLTIFPPLVEFGRDKGGSATITLSNDINSSFDKSWNQRHEVEPRHLTSTAIKETRILCPLKLSVPQTNHLQSWKSWNM